MAKTNFDKWKQGLKPEDLLVFDENYGNIVATWGCDPGCGRCPAIKFCEERKFNGRCRERFIAWANAEAVDDNEDGDDFIKWNKNKEKGL